MVWAPRTKVVFSADLHMRSRHTYIIARNEIIRCKCKKIYVKNLAHFFRFLHLFSIPALLSPSLPLVVVVVAQIRGHIAAPPLSSPLRYNNAFIFIARRIFHREKDSAFFLPSSTRVDLCLTRLLGVLSAVDHFVFCNNFANKLKISNACSIRG